MISNRLLTVVSELLLTIFLLFWCFLRVSEGDLTRLVMLFSGSKQHSKPGILLFWSLLFFYYAFFMVESNWYYVLFSFLLPPTTLRFYLLLCIGPSVFALIAHAQLMAFCILRYISHSLLSWAFSYDNNYSCASGRACLPYLLQWFQLLPTPHQIETSTHSSPFHVNGLGKSLLQS